MVDAGIHPNEESLASFNDVKMNKKIRFALYKIDGEQIVVEKIGGLDATWDDFLKLLPSEEPRFGVFDYSYTTNEKPPRPISKLVFIGWSPDNSDVKLKMKYASTKQSFKTKLGIAKDLQATDLSDPFKQFVEIGRAVYINFGKDQGKLAVILDILNENRVLIEGPESGVERQVIPIRRLTLTKFRVPVLKNQRTGVVRKAIQKFKLQEQWSTTGAAKKIAAKTRRASLTDFDRFKVMLLKKRLNKTVVGRSRKLKKEGASAKASQPAPKKDVKEQKRGGKK